jgi:predicted glutamine amidotransferase
MILTNTAKLKHKQLSKLLTASAKIMGKSDNDGFGWSMLNGNKFVGERCLDPEYFENRFFNNGAVPDSFKAIFEAWESNAFGKIPEIMNGGLLIHARISTNQVSLNNTHPLNSSLWSVIHNGIVQNMGEEYKQRTTNDSEHVLHYLTEQGLEGIVQNLAGYYAIGALNKVTGELMVIKDATANLNACWIPSIESMAFGTNADQLKSILKEGGLTHTKIYAIKDNMALTFNRNGELIKQEGFIPRKESYYSQAQFEASYGSSAWQNDYMDDTYPSDWRSNLKTYPTTPSRNNGVAVENALKVVQDSTKEVHSDIQTIRDIEDSNDIPKEPFDLLDDNGYPVPKHRLDSMFYFVDYDGNEMTAIEYLELESDEKQFCEVYDKASGHLVGRIAS